jgi:DNA-directed RNA polymerase subunit RPC12/RpoP
MISRMHRVECLDCGKVAFRLIPEDIPVYCRECGSAALMWRPV